MISIFTPAHSSSSKYLIDAYNSLLEQTVDQWQWVIVLNNGGYVAEKIKADPRVKITTVDHAHYHKNNIGYLKNFAVKQCDGSIAVEMDADDLLTTDCLEEITNAFENDQIVFAYSNFAEFTDVNWKPNVYSATYGWQQRPFNYAGHELIEMVAFDPTPHSFRRVEWAPNHVRAWRVSDYWKIGGHDERIECGDDHQLLCRLFIEFGASRINHIDKCLYLYRVHKNNTCKKNNNDVQKQVMKNYVDFSRGLAIKWADDNGLRKIDLGGRFGAWENFETVDLLGADIEMDLNQTWQIDDDSVGVINASHIFEHLADPIHTMNEAFRVLAPGGFLFVEVPSTDGRGAFQDPTHVSFWNENSIWYYTHKDYAKYIRPKYVGRFQNIRTITYYPNDHFRNNHIPVVQSDLVALKGWYDERPVGEITI